MGKFFAFLGKCRLGKCPNEQMKIVQIILGKGPGANVICATDYQPQKNAFETQFPVDILHETFSFEVLNIRITSYYITYYR